VAYGLAAYGWWGLVPIYFRAVAHVAPLEVLAHRTVWSFLLLLGLLAATRPGVRPWAPFRDPRTRALLLGTSLLIAANWLVFIWAVTNQRVIEASLGYFINPLVSVLLGRLFLGERLRPAQAVAVALAVAGVVFMTVAIGRVPAVAVALALSFGLYGLLRKKARLGGVEGLLAETGLLLPLALGWLGWLFAAGRPAFGHVGRGTDLLLVLGGVVTALPLIWFAEAARRLRLATVGFLQYVAPSTQLLLAVAAFGEPFTPAHRVAFPLIWAGLAVYSLDALVALRRDARR
jgi:chloramphenicol-sensitive protein RarD